MKPRHPMPTNCPVTGDPLEVTRLENPQSGIVIEGRFVPNEFALLPPDQLEFMRLFIKVRGNLKEIERILGLSYPTVRHRFDTVLKTLGYEGFPDEAETDRSSVLEMLEKGELTPEEATKRLKSLRNR